MKQYLPITIEFQVEHTPDNSTHLLRVAQAYFRGKGVVLDDNGTIVI